MQSEFMKNRSLVSHRKASLHEIRTSINLKWNQSKGLCDFLLDNSAGLEKKIQTGAWFGDWRLEYKESKADSVAHTFNPRTLETEADRSRNLRVVWST